MAFTIDKSASDRPLGFAAALAPDGASPLRGWIAVEQHASDRPGATVAALLPPRDAAGAANRFTLAQLRRSSATLRALAFVPAALDEEACARLAERVPRAAGIAAGIAPEQIAFAPLEGGASATVRVAASAEFPWVAKASPATFTRLCAALRTSTMPFTAASTRGIVDGHKVSLLGVASGRLRPDDRGALRVTLLTDARVSSATLEGLLEQAARLAIVTLAGFATPHPDDGIVAVASGLAGAAPIDPGTIGFETLRVATTALLQTLGRNLLEQAWQPEPACVIQVSVVGGRDAADAAREAETRAADPELLALVAGDSAPTANRRRSRDGSQAAIVFDLARGGTSATRWTTRPR